MTSRQQALIELAKRNARKSLLAFMRFCWDKPWAFAQGRHTEAICAEIDEAVERFKRGESTYLDIEVAQRHGKSDISSVFAIPKLLGSLSGYQPDVMLLAHSQGLANDFSKKCKGVVSSARYQVLFPDVNIQRGRDRIDSWGVAGSSGVCTFAGLGGGYIGKGAAVLVIDDFCAGKDDARSAADRKTRWEGFTDALSRLAPVHIVMLVATSWHVDDVRGRLKEQEKTNPDFPQFKHLSFPAKNKEPDKYGKWLFPERFSEAWYLAQYAAQQSWASALLDCNPVVEGGNRFNPDNVILHGDLSEWHVGRDTRGWDLASSSKERGGDEPDWTWGVRGHVTKKSIGFGAVQETLWIRAMTCIRAEAPERDVHIRNTAIADGAGVAQAIEAFGAYKDAYTTMKRILGGASIVRASRLSGDKSAKAAPMEPIFESRNVHIYVPDCARCLEQWKIDFAQFPEGVHDDAVDATAVMYHENTGRGRSHALI